ncbi:MAG: helix-turn-helix domain-containing protein [Pirellulales bacterium]
MAQENKTMLAEQFRKAIRESGLSYSQLAADSGVDKGILSRFMAGYRSMTLDTAEKLANFLRLKLVKK